MLNEIYHAIDPIIFSIGPLSVRWYGLAYVIGFALCSIVMVKVAQHWKIKFTSDDMLTVLLFLAIGVILGGRLGYVIFYGGSYYWEHPLEIFATTKGGMSFHGGLLGALIAGVCASKKIKMSCVSLFDLGAIGAPIGLFFGRCANFINGELWGAPSDLPWAVVFGGSAGNIPRHPSQLYEALLEGALLFLVLFILSRKVPARPQGSFIGMFFLFYGIARFAIEFVRQPDVQLGYLWGGWLTMGQLLSVPLIIGGIVVLIYAKHVNIPQTGVEE